MRRSLITILVLTWPLLVQRTIDAQPKTRPPSNDKVATVFGRDIFRSELAPPPEWLARREEHIRKHGPKSGFVSVEQYRRQRLSELIIKPLFQEYRESEKLDPTDEEIAEFVVHFRRAKAHAKQRRQETLVKRQHEAEQLSAKLGARNISEREKRRLTQQLQKVRAEMAALEKLLQERDDHDEDDEYDRWFAQWWVARWKLQESLYRRYGGRVIHQQIGPEAIDAMRDFLREQQRLGRFSISDKSLSAVFWVPFERANPGVLVRNPQEVFAKPWSSFD